MDQHPILKATYASRAESATHPLTAYLFRLMELKSSNLCVSADVSTARDLLHLADKLGPSIVVLKTHYDIISGWDFNPHTGTGAKLAALARRHGFLIFEDRKFGDIGNTVQLQYVAGSARIIDWAHIVNVNMLPGKASVTALADAAARWRERYPYEVRTSVTVGTPRSESFDDDPPSSAPQANGNTADGQSGGSGLGDGKVDGRKGSIVSVTTVTQHYEPATSPRLTKDMAEGDETVFAGIEEAPTDRGLLILAQMSTVDTLAGPAYTAACVEAAREHGDFVMGFVSQQNLNTTADDQFLSMTPGCQLPPEGEGENGVVAGDGKGQQYNTPRKLIVGKGVDMVIVGRGILNAADQKGEAERYRKAAWEAYLERVR
ncbi:probable orotidine-5`-phosphate decarboxylase Pyr-4 [Cephalotrichum gorgonifer]|uniref:Orotidine 5'-phosphate decarboxylase n=1 Tax=Cephalotrichum gorgonifer TaxID=2041049 RepID=A0AAE8N480_9PEZI|nr:probable orotidine-5`-phosphate decarboxylase Pyr-4 [Cephalotrichum gorgonifer]